MNGSEIATQVPMNLKRHSRTKNHSGMPLAQLAVLNFHT